MKHRIFFKIGCTPWINLFLSTNHENGTSTVPQQAVLTDLSEKKHKSSVKVGKPLPGVVGGDVEIIETCKGFQQPSSPGEYADFWLPSIPSNRNSECQQRNDTKKPPQNIRNFTMNHLSQGVFFSHCRQQTNCFFSLVAKIATVSLGFLTPMWSSWIRCFAQSLFKMGNPFVLEKLGSNAKKTKPSFSLSCNFSLSVERCQNRNEINEIKSLFGMGRVCSIYIYIRMISIFWQYCSNSGASWQEQPTILFKKNDVSLFSAIFGLC